jgi:membrane protein implicated in regulation of membrane protease activity
LSSFERTDEDEVMIGKVVEVVEDIAPDGAPGRVGYQGTTWEAFSQSRIEKGQFVKIVERKNLTLIVEPVENP